MTTPMPIEGNMKTVCVTGAGGFIGAWLVKLLLSRGYTVHGTVRDTSERKTSYLRRLDKAADNLKLFKADLLDYDSMAAAIAGCQGVFHVASPVPSEKLTDPELQMLAPAVSGTTNVLKGSSAANVQRVVVVSSMVAVEIHSKDWPSGKIRGTRAVGQMKNFAGALRAGTLLPRSWQKRRRSSTGAKPGSTW